MSFNIREKENGKREKLKQFLKRYKNEIIFIILFILVLLFYRCPFKLIFGIDCPGCGITRAFKALCMLDFKAAFELHPMIFVIVPEAAYYVLTRYIIKKNIGKKAENIILWATIIAMLAVWVLRQFILN